MRRAFVLAALTTLAGCSVGADKETNTARGAASEVDVVVTALQRSVARGDYATICDDLFTTAARRRSGGSRCARLLRSQAGPVRRPRVELAGLAVHGDAAVARLRSRAVGQALVTDAVELRREHGEWRIEALR